MATIITKNSQTASAVPAAASLEVGELAVNTADGKLYTEHTGGIVKEIIPSTVVDGGISTAKIADSAVTTAKIANANVTVAKLSASGTPSSSTFLRGDGSWVAPTSGGVTSLNGQTGAITNTDYGSIGSVAIVANNSGSNFLPGNTTAGSNLYYATTITSITSNSNQVFSQGNGGLNEYTVWQTNGNTALRRQSGNSGGSPPAGSAALSGTWRIMTVLRSRASEYDSYNNLTFNNYWLGLAVRIS